MRISDMRDLIEQTIPDVKNQLVDLPKDRNEMTESDWFDLAKLWLIDLIRAEYYEN